LPKVVPMPPATTVPMTPTSSDTRRPKISRERTSRPWKSVPSRAGGLAPSAQKGGAKILAPGIGSVGSNGAIALANTATSTNGTRIASGTTGNCPAKRSQRRRRPAQPGERGAGLFGDIRHRFYLPGQADAGVDVGVADVDRQVDDHD